VIAAALHLASTPSPSPSTPATPDADLVTPGLWGFVALFFLAVAVYFLGRSMARRVRRVNQRARVEAELREVERGGSEVGRVELDEQDARPGTVLPDGARPTGAHERLETEAAQTAADEDPPASR